MPHFDTVCMETSCLFRFNLKRHLSFLVIKSQIVSNQNGPCLIFGHLFARIVANMNGGVCCDRDSHPYSGHRPLRRNAHCDGAGGTGLSQCRNGHLHRRPGRRAGHRAADAPQLLRLHHLPRRHRRPHPAGDRPAGGGHPHLGVRRAAHHEAGRELFQPLRHRGLSLHHRAGPHPVQSAGLQPRHPHREQRR